MSTVRFTRDSAGIREVLMSDAVGRVISALAAQVAQRTRASLPAEVDVVADDYRTDRAASSVTIRDGRGRLWQVRDGILTRAAAEVGLEVKAR